MKISNITKGLVTALSSATILASTIAIIDSGTDMLHKDIFPKAWMNELEIADNQRDEDRNGYEDDVFGWNFAEGNSKVIDYSYLGLLNQDVSKFFELQEKSMRGTITEEEIKWVRTMLSDPDFLKRLQVYGNFMHGTHVAGISASKSDDAKILAVKLIPTEVKLPGQKIAANSDKGIIDILAKAAIDQLAIAQTQMFSEIAYYISDHGARVANGSFGTGYPQAKMLVETLLKTISKKDPDPQVVEKYATYFLNALVQNSQAMLKAAPNTLFVFAAGNDGLDNDIYPISPTNIQGKNEISVAATMDFDTLAPFSNYGEEMVDVAAPGVGILSTAPGNQYVKVSGTSQAAPYVAGVAGQVFDINPALSPVKVKEIILGTVDKKSFLSGKVKTGGIVNKNRASRAATLSLTMDIRSAVSESLNDIADMKSNSNFEKSKAGIFIEGSVLPLPSNFVLR